MSAAVLIFSLFGLTVCGIATVCAIFNREDDRLAEGLLIGIYLGGLGTISLIAILRHLGAF